MTEPDQATARQTNSTHLDETAMAYLRVGAQERSYSDGAAIVTAGEAGRAFYVVTAGEADVILTDGNGRRLHLARLSAGASFGEMSLLTDDPVSADVIARGGARVLAYPGDRFQAALAECEPLRTQVLARLADSLRNTSSEAWTLFQRAEALSALMHLEDDGGPLIAESARMHKAAQQIAQVAQRSGPVLITGEPGTGKLFAARMVHESMGEDDRPLIVVDCQRVDLREACRLLFGSDDPHPDGQPSGFGAVHLATRGTLVLRHIEALDRTAQQALGQYLQWAGDAGQDPSRQARVVATTAADLAALAEPERFAAALLERLSANVLEIPRLADRKRDILPLASLFLHESAHARHDPEQRFTQAAEHALLAAQYRYHNVAELREAVDFAALFADGAEIDAEHIFTGPKAEETGFEYDLGRAGVTERLVNGRTLAVLRGAVFVFFLAIAVVCLSAGDTVAARIANSLTWGLWWPVLAVSFLLVGRVWCMVCPISSAGRFAQGHVHLDHSPPRWLKKHSGWMTVLLFFIIVWTEHVFRMTERPFATGILLLALMAVPAVLCVLYKREPWCRYLCPLGGLGASYATPAPVHVRAKPGVCATQCTTHECYKGSATAEGCPVSIHPVYVRDGHLCKLCLQCMRVCQHGSPSPHLRPPLQGIWALGDLGEALVPFALFVFLLSPVLLASQQIRWIAAPLGFSLCSLGAVGCAFASHRALKRLFVREQDADPAIASRVAFVLLLLGWGPFMAFHLEHIPGLAELQLAVAPGSWWARLFVATAIPLLPGLQMASILLGATLASLSLWRIRVRLRQNGGEPTAWSWRVLAGVGAAYCVLALALMWSRGLHQ